MGTGVPLWAITGAPLLHIASELAVASCTSFVPFMANRTFCAFCAFCGYRLLWLILLQETSMFFRLKYLVAVLALCVVGCGSDDPVSPQEEHFEPEGLVLIESGRRFFRYFQGEIDAGSGRTDHLDVPLGEETPTGASNFWTKMAMTSPPRMIRNSPWAGKLPMKPSSKSSKTTVTRANLNFTCTASKKEKPPSDCW